MPRNGSGSFSVYTPGNPAVTGTTISSTAFNNTMSDIATALTQSIAADGQTPITANIPFNSKKITGLAAGTTSGDALSYGQSGASLATPSISAPAFSGTATGSLTNLALTTPTLTTPTIASGATLTGGATFDNLTVTNGVAVGNTANASATILDWYEEGSFTPTIAFGGGSTGVTYSVNRGANFTRIGNRVTVDIRVLLTNKGSSTGAVTIKTLPYAMSSSGNATECVCAVDYSGLTGLTGALVGIASTGSTSISLFQTGAAATAAITDANVTNTADILLTLTYRV